MRDYTRRDLLRNPWRTLTTLGGVALGVALFSGVLFFVDAAAATMTRRAVAPLALDMQRVLSTPLGQSLSLTEQLSVGGPLTPGQQVVITLEVVNDGADPANEVVIKDVPATSLVYVAESTTLNGHAIADLEGQSPLAHGPGRIGLNIGTVSPGQTVTLTYAVRATSDVGAVEELPLRGTVSSREAVVPIAANGPRPVGLEQLATPIADIPGVAAADALSFVDLASGSLRAGALVLPDPVRVFAFDQRYVEHYPSIRITAGSFAPDAVMLSAEASRGLEATAGTIVELLLPGDVASLSLPVSGVTDLSRAKPLFSSRKSSKFEDFLYVANAVVVSQATFEGMINPAFQAANAARGSITRNEPVREIDVLVDRSALPADPAGALKLTQAIARSIEGVAPGQDHLIDNISNTLEVARDDAVVGKRMFVFLGLPAALLAAVLAAYAASIHAAAQRREQATLRLHGADRRALLRVLVGKAFVLAGAGAVLGTALGYASVSVILGRETITAAATPEIVRSALIAMVMGLVITGLALYLPARRALARPVADERREIVVHDVPAWRRRRLDIVLLLLAIAWQFAAQQAGAFDAPVASVTAGETVSLPSALLLAPMVVWFSGVFVCGRGFEAVTSRLPLPNNGFGPVGRGTLLRSLRRRPREIVNGVVSVGLVVAFGLSLALFAATYDDAKAADARLTVGSDLRITPSPDDADPQPREFAVDLRVGGVDTVTPVVFELDNAVLIGPFDQDRRDLAALDTEGFASVAPLSDLLFSGQSATDALAILGSVPNGVLVDSQTHDDLAVEKGDDVQVLLARGTDNQITETLHVVGVFDRFPGFPRGVHLVMNLAYYQESTGLTDVDYFLARTTDHSHAGLSRAVEALESGPGARRPISIDSTETTFDRDQSSLTALNVNGLVDLNSLYTLLMTAAAVAIFVFGLTLHRRREYVIMRAQGASQRELRMVVLGESVGVAIGGLAAGMVVGAGMGYMFVQVLRPLFVLDPILAFPILDVARLVGASMAASLASALTASAFLRRLQPAELLREI
ncbi:MAG: FtsX-like permease family protein [Ilumatobacteraceae bacterium]